MIHRTCMFSTVNIESNQTSIMRRLTYSLSALLLAFVMIGCSGGSDTEPQSGTEAEAQQDQEEQSMSQPNTINVYGLDRMKFAVRQQRDNLQTGQEITVNGTTYYILEGITAQAGQELTIKLETISTLPASAMSHNWLLLQMNTDVQAFSSASSKAKDNDYVAADMEDRVITDTGLVGGGESASVSFTVPEQTGQYDYLCTFPGHFTAGMRGTLTVK